MAKMIYSVYGILSPISKAIFYVGMTQREVSVRISQHASDPLSAAFGSIQWFRSQGLREDYCIIDTFTDWRAARRFEADMIRKIGGLRNREDQDERDRSMVASMLSDEEVESILAGRNCMVYRRYTDYDDVDENLKGTPMSPADASPYFDVVVPSKAKQEADKP